MGNENQDRDINKQVDQRQVEDLPEDQRQEEESGDQADRGRQRKPVNREEQTGPAGGQEDRQDDQDPGHS